MTANMHVRTSVSALMGAAVTDTPGQTVGHVRVRGEPREDSAHVRGVLVRLSGAARGIKSSLVPISSLQLTAQGAMQLRDEQAPLAVPESDDFLLLERDLLDQQIIDVHGHKAVRVNDVDLVWEKEKEDGSELSLRIAKVEVGVRGAIRRLLKGLPSRTVESTAARVKPSVIPWEFVDLIDRDPSRAVELKIEQEQLWRMHPSDIAGIFEELAPAERQTLFRSVDEEVAAEALEEVEPKMQRLLIEDLDSESVAGIVEEMDPGAATDLLSELKIERSDAILEEMNPEERHEVEELLDFSSNSAAGRMTTEYLALGAEATVAEAVAGLGTFEGDVETLTDVYVLDERGRLSGTVPLVKLLLGTARTTLATSSTRHLVTCHLNERVKKVAELFDKYNLRSMLVVDEEKRMVGVILAEHVIAQLGER